MFGEGQRKLLESEVKATSLTPPDLAAVQFE